MLINYYWLVRTVVIKLLSMFYLNTGTIVTLERFRVTEFWSIRDSGDIRVDEITCLVGKNEAGKTALLEALRRINPLNGTSDFNVTDDYPRMDVEDYRQAVESGSRKHAKVIEVEFKLSDEACAATEAEFGPDSLRSRSVVLSKGYDNVLRYTIQGDESAALKHLVGLFEFIPEVLAKLSIARNASSAIQTLDAAEQTEDVAALRERLSPITSGGINQAIWDKIVQPQLPKFLYFDEYHQMRGRDNLDALKRRLETNTLEGFDHPLLGLISLARLDIETMLNPGRTQELKNRLQGAGNHLTKRIVKYWSQNKHLQMHFDVRPAQPGDPEGMQVGTNVWGEVYDSKHWVSTGLETRSRGFVWFFSFLAWYSDLRNKGSDLVLLLDEPGLSLHAKAQEDLLKYFEAEIAGTHQLVYTTHSPFMVDARRFERVRIVQDKTIDFDDVPDEQAGTRVIEDVLLATPDSLFPLQGALGYEIYQSLFIGPNSLVVEGASDLLYLQTMSHLLEKMGRTSLDTRWTITPVGGSDKVPTFVALIGARTELNVAVLIDYQKKDRQALENLYKSKLIKKTNIVTFADFVDQDEADIEDMFQKEFYLELVNAEYSSLLDAPIEVSKLTKRNKRVVVQIEGYFAKKPLANSITFNHYRPARRFVETVSAVANKISNATLDRFEECFKRVNALLKIDD